MRLHELLTRFLPLSARRSAQQGETTVPVAQRGSQGSCMMQHMVLPLGWIHGLLRWAASLTRRAPARWRCTYCRATFPDLDHCINHARARHGRDYTTCRQRRPKRERRA